jgi:hypothetical protein
MNNAIHERPTADEVMNIGLQYVGYNHQQLQCCRSTLLSRFRSHYGSNPIVYSEIFEDLQTTILPNARIEGSQICLKRFLMAIHFLQCYSTEHEISAKFGFDEKTARKWIKFFVLKVHALKPQKVCSDSQNPYFTKFSQHTNSTLTR